MRGVRKGFVRLFGGISLCSLKWGWFSNACKINRWNNFLLRFWRRARCFSGNSTVKSYRLASSNLFNFSSSLLGGIHEWGESSFSILFFFSSRKSQNCFIWSCCGKCDESGTLCRNPAFLCLKFFYLLPWPGGRHLHLAPSKVKGRCRCHPCSVGTSAGTAHCLWLDMRKITYIFNNTNMLGCLKNDIFF